MKLWMLPVTALVGALISAGVVIGVMAWEPWNSDSGNPVPERIVGCDRAYMKGDYLHGRCIAEARSSEERWACYVEYPDSADAREACRDAVAAQSTREPATPPGGNPSPGDEGIQYAFLVLAASAITGAVGIGGIYIGHRLTRRSEIEEEARGFHREQRRTRVQPVVDFLDAVKRYIGDDVVLDVKERLLELSKDKPKLSAAVQEDAERIVKSTTQAELDLLRKTSSAVMASPSKKMMVAIEHSHDLILEKSGDWVGDLRDAITEIEADLDEWIIGSV